MVEQVAELVEGRQLAAALETRIDRQNALAVDRRLQQQNPQILANTLTAWASARSVNSRRISRSRLGKISRSARRGAAAQIISVRVARRHDRLLQGRDHGLHVAFDPHAEHAGPLAAIDGQHPVRRNFAELFPVIEIVLKRLIRFSSSRFFFRSFFFLSASLARCRASLRARRPRSKRAERRCAPVAAGTHWRLSRAEVGRSRAEHWPVAERRRLAGRGLRWRRLAGSGPASAEMVVAMGGANEGNFGGNEFWRGRQLVMPRVARLGQRRLHHDRRRAPTAGARSKADGSEGCRGRLGRRRAATSQSER